MNVKCISCLATDEAKMYHSLTETFPVYMKTVLPVSNILELVTSTRVTQTVNFPKGICTTCLKQLRDCYNYIEKFKSSQKWLKDNLKQTLNPEQVSTLLKVDSSFEKLPSETESIIIKIEENSPEDSDKLPVANPTDKINVNVPERTDREILETKKSTFKSRSIQVRKRPFSSKAEVTIKKEIEEEGGAEAKNAAFIDHTYQKLALDLDNSLNTKSTKNVVGISKKPRGNKRVITQPVNFVKNSGVKMGLRRTKKLISENIDNQNYICHVCGQMYDSAKRLSLHIYSLHAPQEKFKCNICGEICRTPSAYTHHKHKHIGKKIHCDECSKSFLTNTHLLQHKKRAHGGGLPCEHLCNECGKVFKYKNALQYHLVSAHHEQEKPFMCRYCSFRCIQKSYLKRHERSHTDERPYKCKYCNRSYRGSSELQNHLAYHEGKMKFYCKYCGKGFLRAWNMKVHWLQHRGLYDCDICSKSFIDEKVLNFHNFHKHKIKDEIDENASVTEELHNLETSDKKPFLDESF